MKYIRQHIWSSLLFLTMVLPSVDAQEVIHIDDLEVWKMVIEEGDTFMVAGIEEVYIFSERKFKNERERRRYTRLIRNVKKAYPWAKLSARILQYLERNLEKIPEKRDQKRFTRVLENELFDKYEEELKQLTITQGRILIKLVDRETGDTSYNLVREFRGSLSAFFWQTLARLFGSNLKDDYDPGGEDRDIEEIVQMIEKGVL